MPIYSKIAKGVTLLPPAVYDREEKPKEVIVNTTDIIEGNIEYDIQRTQSLFNSSAAITEEPFSPQNSSEAMRTIGTELGDSSVAKDDVWWKKALGWLEPFKYLDIPVELAAEAVFDPLAAITGRDLSWVRGTAERKPYEAWSALFSHNDVSTKTGFGELMARMDIAADAFDKRPLLAQLGLGAVQMAASFGSAGWVKAAAATGKHARLARAARAGAFVFDPWEIPFYGVSKGYKGIKYLIKTPANIASDGVPKAQKLADDLANQQALDETGEPLPAREPVVAAVGPYAHRGMAVAHSDIPVTGSPDPDDLIDNIEGTETGFLPTDPQYWKDRASRMSGIGDNAGAPVETRADYVFNAGVPKYSLRPSASVIGNVTDGGSWVGADIHNVTRVDDRVIEELPWGLRQSNQLFEFISDQWRIIKSPTEGAEVGEVIASTSDRLEAARKGFAAQLAKSVGSRKNYTFKATRGEIWGTVGNGRTANGYSPFIDSGRLGYTQTHVNGKPVKGAGRSTLLSPLDQGEARLFGELYQQQLIKWAEENSTTIEKAMRDAGRTDYVWNRDNPLDWIIDEDQILTFDMGAAENGAARSSWFKNNEAEHAWDDIDAKSSNNSTLDDILANARKDDRFSLLPEDSRFIRNMAVNEIVLRGGSFESAAHLLQHGDTGVTAMYVTSAPNLGANSIPAKLAATTKYIRDIFIDANPDVQHAIDQRYKHVKEYNGPLTAAKGAIAGGEDELRLSIEVGETILRDENIAEELFSYMDNAWLDVAAKQRGEGVIRGSLDDMILSLADEAIEVDALIKKAEKMMEVESYAMHTKLAIYKDIGKKINRRTHYEEMALNPTKMADMKRSKPGIMNRAGYYVVDGKIHWAGDSKNAKVKAEWTKQRTEMSKRNGMNSASDVWTDKEWMEWAESHYTQYKNADDIIDVNNHVRLSTKRKSAIKLYDSILEYADIRIEDLMMRYAELADPQNMLGIEGVVRRKEELGFDALFGNMARSPVSRAGKRGTKMAGGGKILWADTAYYQAKAKLDRMITTSSALDRLWMERQPKDIRNAAGELVRARDADGKVVFEYKRIKDAIDPEDAEGLLNRINIPALRDFVNDKNVASAFNIFRITGKTTPGAEMTEKLWKMQNRFPRLFGEHWADWRTKHPEEAEKFINYLGDMLQNHRDLWTHIDYFDLAGLEREIDRLLGMRQGRDRLKFAAGLEDRVGNTSEIVAGVDAIPDISSVIPRITGIGKWMNGKFNEWINGEAMYQKILKNAVVAPVFTVIGGGMAGIARPITKAISARSQLYPIGEAKGVLADQAFLQWATDMTDPDNALKYTVDEPTTLAQAAGVKSGLEYFEGIDIRPLSEILEAEATLGMKVKNAKWIKGKKTTSANGGIAHRLTRITAERDNAAKIQELGLGDAESLTAKLLTNPDILLERINPEDWPKYFKNLGEYKKIPGTEEIVFVPSPMGEKILMMRDTIYQIDTFAKNRGIDIRKIIEERGVEYLEEYFPRIYQSIMLVTGEADGVLTNGIAKHFKARDKRYYDIADVLANSLGLVDAPNYTLALHPFHVRAGLYIASMHKEIIDRSTIAYLSTQQVVAQGNKTVSAFNQEKTGLDSLKALLNEKIGKEVAETPPTASQMARLVNLQGTESQSLFDEFGLDFFNSPTTKLSREQLDNTMNTINRRIGEMEQNLADRVDLAPSLGGDFDWLGDTLDNISTRDKKAVRQYLEVTSNFLQAPLQIAAGVLRRPTNMMRYLKSGLDAGAPMIHGYNSLIRFPTKDVDAKKAWFNATRTMATFWMHPDRLDAYQVAKMDLRRTSGQYVKYSGIEPLVAMDDDAIMSVKAWVKKHADRLGWGPETQRRFLSRFENGFTGFLDVLRDDLWEMMVVSVDNELDDMIKAAKGTMGEGTIAAMRNEKYHELGAVINKMTGAFDQHLSQQTPLQSLLENSLFFFAPMYRRATYGILADIFRFKNDESGIGISLRQEQAFRQLSGVVVAGAGMAMLAEMTGNNTRAFLFDEDEELAQPGSDLDITSRFGKFNVHGVQLGIGTAWWTAFRAASDIAMNMAHDERAVDDSKHWSEHWVVEMLGRRGRSQLAPGSALFTDIISGRNFIGEPLRDGDENNWAAIGRHVGKSAIPFWLDGAFADNSIQGRSISMASEFLGLQSYELSSYDRLVNARRDAILSSDIPEIAEWRQERMDNNEFPAYKAMPKTLQNLLDSETANVYLLVQEHEKKYGETASGTAAQLRTYMSAKNDLDLRNVQHLASVSRKVEIGEASYRDLQQAIGQVKYNKRIANASLLQRGDLKELGQYFIDLRTDRETASDVVFQGDIIYDKWQSVRNNPQLLNADGEYNIELANMLEVQFWNEPHNNDFRDYVMERSNMWYNALPTVRRFEEAKDRIRESGYWDVHSILFARGSRDWHMADRYLRWSPDMQRAAIKGNPDYARISRALTNKRQELQTRNPQLDRDLVEFYYNTERHPSNAGLGQRLIGEKLGNNYITPGIDAFSISATGRIVSQ